MMRALWSAASGMRAQQTNVDVISNNLSNVNTAGYKSSKAEFKTLLYQNIQAVTTSQNGEEKPISAQVGLGTRLASTTTSFKEGSFQTSDSNSHFAIAGEGFFQVRGADGEMYYTRSGNFLWTTNAAGNVQLCTQDGYAVLNSTGGEITLPAGITGEAAKFSSSSGELGYTDAAQTYHGLGAYIGLWQFRNDAGLDKVSNTLFQETDASGAAINEYTSNTVAKSSVKQGYLEASNVQVADEMVNLIVAQRAYELNSKAIQASDDMLGQANQLRR